MKKQHSLWNQVLGISAGMLLFASCGGGKGVAGNDPQQGLGKPPGKTTGAHPGTPVSLDPGPSASPNPAAPGAPGIPATPAAIVLPSDQPEFYFLGASAAQGDGAQVPAWPALTTQAAVREALITSEKKISGAPARVGQELRYEKVVQIPQPDQPQLFLVLKEQLEGVPIINVQYESYYYDADNNRHGTPGLRTAGVMYARKSGFYYLPLSRVIAELKGRVEAGDARERIEVIFNLELQSKGMRQWSIHFSVDAPLPEIPVKHFATNFSPFENFSTGDIDLYHTSVTNPLMRDLVLWADVQTGKVGTHIGIGQIDRYADDVRSRGARPVRTDTLKAAADISLDSIEVFSAPLAAPTQLKSVGKFRISDRTFSYPIPPESVIELRWWGKFSVAGCPSLSRKREFKWIEQTARNGQVPDSIVLEETFRAIGKRVTAQMQLGLRITDANWRKEKSVFHAKAENYSNLRVISGVPTAFYFSELPSNYPIPAQVSCNSVYLN